jgi:hypothetical protein
MKSDLLTVKTDIREEQSTPVYIVVGTVNGEIAAKPPKKKVLTLEELGYSFEMGM